VENLKEEGLAYLDVSKSLADWGEREGDTAVVATINSIPVSAAWFRFWTDGNSILGYIDESTHSQSFQKDGERANAMAV
jgi:hypothetical protein